MNLRNAYEYASAALRYTRLYLYTSKETAWLRSVSLMLSVPNSARALGTLRLNPGIAELTLNYKPTLRVTLPRLHDLWTEANARPERELFSVICETEQYGARYVKKAPKGGLYLGNTPALFESAFQARRYIEGIHESFDGSVPEWTAPDRWRVVSGRFNWSDVE